MIQNDTKWPLVYLEIAALHPPARQRYEIEQNGIKWNRTQANGMNRNDTEWKGTNLKKMDQNGYKMKMQWNEMESIKRDGMERTGMKWTKNWTKLRCNGMKWNKTQLNGMDRNEMDRK